MKTREYAAMVAWIAALVGLAPAASGQSIAERVAGVNDGKIRMAYATRPDVCGDGRGSISFGAGRRWVRYEGRDDVEWECEHGPARVVLRIRDGEVRDVDAYVGGRWRALSTGTVDLGRVSAPQAARYLIALARSSDRAADDAIFPAMLADSTTLWPDLLQIAKDGALSEKVRERAVFWLSQEAAAAAGEGLSEIARDDAEDWDIRKTAIFGLSQRPHDEGVPALIHLARTSGDPEIIRQALFWLGQSEDPRAIELFEELLTER